MHVGLDFWFAGKRRYNVKLWKTFTDCFNCLPVAAIIDEKILCMHGGLSPELNSMDQVRKILRPTDVPDTGLSPLASLLVIYFLLLLRFPLCTLS